MSSQKEKIELIKAGFYPFVFVLLMWLVKIVETLFDIRLSFLGVYPLEFKGVPGIALMPLLHGDWNHLISNSVPFLFLGTLIFYFYKEISWKILIYIWLLSGIWLWIGARESYHIGASGVVYGMASFLFLSGILRNNRRLLTLTLIVGFLYGSMIWGFFPEFFPDKNISWEGHLFGFVSGLLLAIYFRKEGPEEEVFVWDDSDVPDDANAYWRSTTPADKTSLSEEARPTRIHYEYKKKAAKTLKE